MAIRRKGVASVGRQLELYRSGNAELVRESVGWKSAEEIREHNRDALLQHYVMKKHRATRLHYDLRLGFSGVLLSWAVPMGPSYCPAHRREAIQVEDHRMEYRNFEGVHVEGKPGAGPVMLWDCGMWRPDADDCDVEEALRRGCLRFTLLGEKLKGAWMLVRRHGEARNDCRPAWELVKEMDSFARDERAKSILDELPNSVRTGRTLEEIERDWRQGKPKRNPGRTLFDL